tara:strand:+ start:495 stop:698 length:204 start_codon:yes stop_codon:yes gene_type:complete
MKLDDEVIAHIAKTVQIGILTGTDVVDHLRMMVLEESDGKLFLNEDYRKNSEENIEKMLTEVATLQG